MQGGGMIELHHHAQPDLSSQHQMPRIKMHDRTYPGATGRL